MGKRYRLVARVENVEGYCLVYNDRDKIISENFWMRFSESANISIVSVAMFAHTNCLFCLLSNYG